MCHSVDSHKTHGDRYPATVVHNRGLGNAVKVTCCLGGKCRHRETHDHSLCEICGHAFTPTVVNHTTNHYKEYNTRFD